MEKKTKKINSSKRGLYISFNGKGTSFDIGNHYKYVIDAKTNKIFMVPSDGDNTLKVSRKGNKAKTKFLSLIDLRNKAILNTIAKGEKLEVTIQENQIVVKPLSNSNVSYIVNAQDLQMASGFDINSVSISRDSSGRMRFKSKKEEDEFKTSLQDVIRVASLFSGAGMLDYPFKLDNKFEIIFGNEIDKNASISYINNIGDHLCTKDIREVTAQDMPEVDVIIGGPPCKPFSNVNRNMNCRLDTHPDSLLMLEYIRLVNSSKAKIFVMENVPQIFTASDGAYLQAIKDSLDKDYEITTAIIKDCDCGGYTTRKRAFIFGSKIGKVVIPDMPYDSSNYKTVKEALDKVDPSWFNYSDMTKSSQKVIERMRLIPQGSNYISNHDKMPDDLKIKAKMANTYRRLSLNGLCCTLTNFTKTLITHPLENRIISIAESIALSGFDSKFRAFGSESSRSQQIGNGVPFKLGEFIKNIVKNTFSKYNTLKLI